MQPQKPQKGSSGAGCVEPSFGGVPALLTSRGLRPQEGAVGGARWVWPWCGGDTGKAPTVREGPQAVRAMASTWFHDLHSVSGPAACGSPNSPQIWLRPTVSSLP